MRYFDHAATTVMRESAREAWCKASYEFNPAGQYQLGRRARSVLEDAREQVAALVGCEPIEVIFTASGTEADNIALKGLWRARSDVSSRVISTAIEHSAVFDTVRYLETLGANLELLPADSSGFVYDPADVFSEPAAVATCMWANNETGAIQDVAQFGEKLARTGTPFHIDAVQVLGKLPIKFSELNATTLAGSGHKFGGPRGAGILIAKRSPAPEPLFHGGGQERGIRSGTVDVAGAAGLAAALQEACDEMDSQQRRLREFKCLLIDAIQAAVPDVQLNTPQHSLSTHVNISIPGAEGDSLIMLLDSHGIAASTGSACANGVNRASRVLLAQGLSESLARGTLRLSMGYTTTEEDVNYLIDKLPKVIAQAKRAGMA
ncbi:cysteine desulfurase family protein [Corynebacterium mustelae]|uniref:Cysteine desulfurase family protein n=1 Tax=Corynebacterium mustelae TaxID=571915 RepID=A0A0G3GWX3_9CORY|nr:cysteine desulfurase family protein [Corynebacterium mustelae]